MVGDSARHATVLDELVEWWQDLSQQEINSRAVLLAVPPGWGRTWLLKQFAAAVKADDTPSVVVPVEGKQLPQGLGVQALKLKELFSEARVKPSVAELLGVNRVGGAGQLGLGVAGLVPVPLLALVGYLLAGLVVGAASRVWDDSPAGQDGAVARLARAVAALSVSVSVVVIIDDADCLEPDLAVTLIENLIERLHGRVLVVAAVNPGDRHNRVENLIQRHDGQVLADGPVTSGGKVLSALTSRAAYGLTEGRIRTVDADPHMDYQARVDLAAELCPNLPDAATGRIGQRTRTFAEVFAVTASDLLSGLDANTATADKVDKAINLRVNRERSRQAMVLAWAGGILHARQAERAVVVLDEDQPGIHGDVVRFESLVRLADNASRQLDKEELDLSTRQRHRLAKKVLDTATEIGGDPRAGLVDKVVAWQGAHRVRDDLQDRAQLAGVQCHLVHALEDLGDPEAAYQVAREALDEYPASHRGQQQIPEYQDLFTARTRLAVTRKLTQNAPFIDTAVAAVAAGEAAVGLEARIWAAIDLLSQPGQRERALELAAQITAELSHRHDLGAVGNRWRLLLAFHVGRAGYTAITQQLLAPMLATSGSPEDEDAARAVLRAVSGPRADIRLQIIGLEAELETLPPDADDDPLRVHHALAADYAHLGKYDQALHHGEQELPLRSRLQGVDHPDTLATRNDIAVWTGRWGNAAEALRLLCELLPDRERVLGPSHPDTLATRNDIALFTREDGHLAEALRLSRELLLDLERVLGPSHPGTLATRHNIAALTGDCGNPAEALRLSQELLPDLERVFGPDQLDTLTTRSHIASQTGECGNPAEALQLYQELLPDLERVFGSDHPNTLLTRNNLAVWTTECGHSEEALRLSRELLPDRERVLGPGHPDTLATRNNIAFWTR